MKLVELELTPVKKSVRTKQRPDMYHPVEVGAQRYGSNLTQLGNPGMYAAAYEHKKRPGTILKIGKFHSSPFEDGYLSFVQAVLKNNRSAGNPYLPRIYGVKIYRPQEKDGKELRGGQYVVEMEKLYKMRELSPEELMVIGSKIFKSWNDDENEPWQLARYLGRAARGDRTILDDIKDKKLLQAISMIHGIEKRKRHISDIELDLHDGNIMFRRTSIGSQLVITDPLA